MQSIWSLQAAFNLPSNKVIVIKINTPTLSRQLPGLLDVLSILTGPTEAELQESITANTVVSIILQIPELVREAVMTALAQHFIVLNSFSSLLFYSWVSV